MRIPVRMVGAAAGRMTWKKRRGLFTLLLEPIVPDLGILSAITMRTIQKLSLVYGFEMNTDDEIAELWIAAASAAGVDISRELLEKGVVDRFVPKVIQRIAARASSEVVEKWAGRLIPIASSAMMPNSARSGWSGSPTRVAVMREIRTT